MMSNEDQDSVIVCRDCGREFIFSAGEKGFYASKGLTNTPSRCPSCRAARRGSQSSTVHAPRGEQYDAICDACGRATTVPFQPSEGRPVYCTECFQAQRASRPPRRDDRSYSSSSNYGGGGRNSRGGGRDGGRDRDRRSRW
jgi:CxxC-x17-CxxC domain-containing protein